MGDPSTPGGSSVSIVILVVIVVVIFSVLVLVAAVCTSIYVCRKQQARDPVSVLRGASRTTDATENDKPETVALSAQQALGD